MNNKTVNVDFVTRAIEIDLDGKEHFIAASLAAEQAIKAKEESLVASQEAIRAKDESVASAALIKARKALWYETVAAMKADKSINAGSYVNTAGYYKANDGGAGSYIIRAKAVEDIEDGGSIHFLQKDLVAELIVENGTVCPEQFGAKGDGVSDDTDAVNHALGYGELIVMLKKYRITSSLLVKSRKQIRGGKILFDNKTHTPLFLIDNQSNLLFEDIEMVNKQIVYDGIDHGSTKQNQSAISCWGTCENIQIINCRINKFSFAGIYFYNCDDILIKNCVIDGLTSVDSPQLTAGSNQCFGLRFYKKLTNAMISNNKIYGGCQGIYIPGDCKNVIVADNSIGNIIGQHGMYITGRCTIRNNHFDAINTNAINIQESQMSAVSEEPYRIYGNQIDKASSAIAVNTLKQSNISLAYIEDNVLKNCGAGIVLKNCENTTIANNNILDSRLCALVLNKSNNVTIKNNYIFNFGCNNVVNNNYGIYISGVNEQIYMINNNVSGTKTQGEYCLIVDGAIGDKTVIVNNIFEYAKSKDVRFITQQKVKRFTGNIYETIINQPTELIKNFDTEMIC